MTELLVGSAFVLSLIALGVALLVANELGALRADARPRLLPADPGPPIVVRTLSGEALQLPSEDRRILLFTLENCQPCEEVIDQLAVAGDELRQQVILLGHAPRETVTSWVMRARLSSAQAVVDEYGALAGRFSVKTYPRAVLTDHGQTLEASSVPTVVELRRIARLPMQAAGSGTVGSTSEPSRTAAS
jgi:hypothetical protein